MTITQEILYNIFAFIAVPLKLFLLKIILLLIAVAFFTLAERKIMGACHRRFGPNEVGSWGVLQPLADGLKLLAKELVVPAKANSYLFFFSRVLILTLSLLSWVVIPFALVDNLVALQMTEDEFFGWVFFYMRLVLVGMIIYVKVKEYEDDNSLVKDGEFDEQTREFAEESEEAAEASFYAAFSLVSNMSYGLLFLLSISSSMAYIMFIGSWSSNSKYAFLGGLRVIAQMVSYEVSMSTTIIPNSVASGTMNLTELVMQQQNTGWYARPLLPCLVIFLISMLAETNRAPFDLPEAESDLVSGYNTEYSSITFAMFFLGEYANMIQMGALVAILFLGGWEMGLLFTLVYLLRLAAVFAFKNVVTSFFFVLVRATYPRYRYDHLMNIGWTVFLPLTFAFLLFFIGILKMTNAFVYVHEIVPQVYYGGILS